MATTQASATHDQHQSPIAIPQTPQGLMSGQRQVEQGAESSLPLHRYLGNSYVQAMATTQQRLGLQTKLTVNEPGDIYEQEADRVADQVMAGPTHANVRSAPLQLQRFAGPSHGQVGAAPVSVDQTLASPGRPLEQAFRQDMEQRFGHDFSRVRVHTGAAAEQSAQDVNAHAYTIGHNIVFGTGQFAPGTTEGRRLIAHELTHVVHQTGSGMPFIQRKEKEDQHNTTTVTQITVEAKTTGEGRGRALTSDGATYQINIEVNNLSPGRFTTGKPLGELDSDSWIRIHLGSKGANQFVYLLPPGVTVAQTMTIIVEPTAREQAEVQIRELKKPIRDFLTREGGRKASEQELLKMASAGRILERYDVTEDELLLEQQRRIDRKEVGLSPVESSNPEDWALSYVGFREQARAAERANATTLLDAAQRLSMASSDLARLIRGTGVLQILEPDTKKLAIAIDLAIRKLSVALPNAAFRNLGELQSVLRTFENALIADLRALATTFLDDTEVRLIRMHDQFVGRGDKQWGPGYLEREIEKVRNDPDVIKVQKDHEAYVKAMEQAELDDLKYNMADVSAENADVEDLLYRERQRERQKERKDEKDRYEKLLRETVAKKSKLKLSPGFDVDDILSANSGRRAQVMLTDSIVNGRAKVREARAKLSEPKFLYAADIVIDKEKEHFGKVLGAKRSDVVHGIIDQLARERRAQTTIWQDIWKVFEFAANFIPGPIGWAARGLGAVVKFDKNISAARDQDILYSTGMSNVVPDPNAAPSALVEAGVQVVTDFSPATKGAKRLTLGLEKKLAGEAARLGEHGVATAGKRELTQLGDEAARLGERGVTNAPGKQVSKPPVPPEIPLKPKRELDQDKLFKKPPVNNTDIDRAALKREAAKPRPQTPPRQQATEAPFATSRPVGNDNVRALTDIEKAAQKRAAATRRPQTEAQQQAAVKELAATGTTGPVAPILIKGSSTPRDRAHLVASGGGNPPGGGTPTPGSVRPSETPAPSPARAPQSQPRGDHPRLIPRDQPRRGFEDEEPTLVDLEPPGQELRGSAKPSGSGPSPSQVGDTVHGEITTAEYTRPPAGAAQGQAQRPPSPATPRDELPATQVPPSVREPTAPGGRAGSPHRWAGVNAVQTTLDTAGMREYVLDVWRQNPLLHRLMEVRRARGPARHQQLLDILKDFERIEGVPVETVVPGIVQGKTLVRGNLASLRSKPGVLQIEMQAYEDTDTLMREVIHELCFHYAGGPDHSRLLGTSGMSALRIFERAIETGEGEGFLIRFLSVDGTPRPRRR